ncbi:Colicin V secretion protein CvaA [Photobacterium damselae]|nr:Colicin V secretion protein CvaA [Photobacterium damselae]
MIEPYFRVKIKPNDIFITYKDNKINLYNGMKATTTLFLESRKLYQWILAPIYDMKNSIMEPNADELQEYYK